MKQTNRSKFLLNPKFQVIVTWVWNFLAALVIMAIVLIALPGNVVTNLETLREHPNYAIIPIFTEIIAAGLLPVLFTALNREKIAQYGLQTKGLVKSLFLSALVMIASFVIDSLKIGQVFEFSFSMLNLTSPWRMILALLAVVAYGPLEVFFFIWLVNNMDRILKSEDVLLSRGLILTTLIYGLLHTVSQGFNSLVIATIMFLLGLVYKHTRNSIGPMLAWTVRTKYIWFLVSVLLTKS